MNKLLRGGDIERVNSRLKDQFCLERHKTRCLERETMSACLHDCHALNVLALFFTNHSGKKTKKIEEKKEKQNSRLQIDTLVVK
jgi:hypothetical protein